MRKAEKELLEMHEAERMRWEQERKSLLDRIQHPERVQAAIPEDYVEPEPPKDAEEMAHIGQIVPDFVNVGSSNGEDDDA